MRTDCIAHGGLGVFEEVAVVFAVLICMQTRASCCLSGKSG